MAFISPESLEAALDALHDENYCLIAGGTDVFPAILQGKTPPAFMDLTRVREISLITQNEDHIRIGATATWSSIVKSDLPAGFDALKQAALEVGSLQIQNAGTIAGNLCNASPAADGVPPLLALNARIEIASAARGIRQLPLTEFIKGVRETDLATDELLTAVIIPKMPQNMTSAFEKLGSRKYLVISICMTAVNLRLDDNALIAEARIAVGSCSAVAQRLTGLEQAIIGTAPDKVKVTAHDLAELSPIDDVRATSGYRIAAAAVQCQRAIKKAAQS